MNFYSKVLFIFVIMFFVNLSTIAQDTSTIKRHLTYLGSDLFEGRGTGSIGGELAAKYIAINLNKYELIPMGYENTFYQYIPMHGTKPKNNSFLLTSANDTLKINEDFQFIKSSGRIFTPNLIPLVFVGYGITAPEYDYDDYENVEVEGKIVIYLEDEPMSEETKYFLGSIPTNYSFSHTKQKLALSKGAVGTIQIPNLTCKTQNDWLSIIQEYGFEDITLAYMPTPTLSLILNPRSVYKLFENSSYSFKQVDEMSKKSNLKSFELKEKILLNFEFERRDFIAPNIVGYLKGNDEELDNEFVVVSAHYDHLGIGFQVRGDSIYNGVLDNAIGVSGLLELARLFGENNIEIKRSIIFLFLTGEEKGLLGATYFCDHPSIPINSIRANVNIDGLSVFGDFNSIVGIGSEYSSLDKILRITADENNLQVESVPKEFSSYESFLRSDQLAFALAGIPSILISDGVNISGKSREDVIQLWNEYIQSRYHTPFDDLNQELDLDAARKHIKILYDFITEVANTDLEIKWHESNPFSRENN